MSAPASDPPAQPPTGNEKTDTPAPAATTSTDAGEVKTEDVEMKKEDEAPVDRFEDVPEHVLKVCFCPSRYSVGSLADAAG